MSFFVFQVFWVGLLQTLMNGAPSSWDDRTWVESLAMFLIGLGINALLSKKPQGGVE